MNVLGWIALLLGGLGLALYASTKAVANARVLIEGTRIPPFLVGVTLMSIGTDLPEMANSLVACATGHGDLNAGDSVGSAVTQATLVLGLLPLIAGRIEFQLTRVAAVMVACIVALILGAALMVDGVLSRADGAVLLVGWLAGSALLWKQLSPASEPVHAFEPRGTARTVGRLLLALAAVGVGATAAVSAFTALSTLLGVPEYILGFFALSLGTSLPELIVDVSAIRSGLRDMALGDVLGSSFVDTTLSLGIGPLVFSSVVSPAVVIPASAVAIGALAVVPLVMALARGQHTWISGSALLAVYGAMYFVLLA